MPLTEQIILITGAGGGLGSTAAVALAKQGADIILLDKNIPKLEIVYDKILAENGPEPAIYPFDLAGANETEYEQLATTIADKYGALHGILHCAADLDAFAPIATHKTASWGHSLNVNLNAPFLLSKVLLPVMQKSEHASIVFISDSSARVGTAYTGAYGVSKIALEGFAKILAEELETAGKIRVNTLVPGPIDSPLRQKGFPGEDKTKLPTMELIVPACVYLFSSTSIGTTGQIFDARTFNQ